MATAIPEIDQTLVSQCQISFLETLHLETSSTWAWKYLAFPGVKNDVFLMKTDLHEMDEMGFFKS